MAGEFVSIDLSSLPNARKLVESISEFDRQALLESLGALIDSQTRRRIQYEQTAPDGTPWPAWSPLYAATRHGNQSLLSSSGHLVDSLQHLVDGDSVLVGSPLVYARIHNRGGIIKPKKGKSLKFRIGGQFVTVKQVTIPRREYLGISDENAEDINADVIGFFQSLIDGYPSDPA